MCTNQRYIINRYTHKKVLVKCGKCPACQQEKAFARSKRIRYNSSHGTIALFITLTYSNDYIPYVKFSDLRSSEFEVPIYRNASCRYTYSRQNGHSFTYSKGTHILENVFIDPVMRSEHDLNGLVSIRGLSKDCISVCYNKDFQDFIKRLKINLQRKYHYENTFSYFYCSEFGSFTKRAHFHALLFIPKDDVEIFRNAVVASWPYADSNRTQKYVEIAKDVASYVSAYVSGSSSFSSIMSNNAFKPKHNYSRYFGTLLDCFSLPCILDCIDRRSLYFRSPSKTLDASRSDFLPIPQYVLNRYFPKFKGVGVLPSSTLRRVLFSPSSVSDLQCDGFVKSFAPCYSYSAKETYSIYVRLTHAVEYFKKTTGLSEFDYVQYYLDCWNLHSSQSLCDSFRDVTCMDDYNNHYMNSLDLFFGVVRSDLDPTNMELCYNSLTDVVQKTTIMTDLYFKLDKQKRVTNIVMSTNGHNV